MIDKELIIVAVGFLGAIIAAWIGARAATRAGKFQARAMIEAALIGRGFGPDGRHHTGLELLEFLLLVLMLLLLAALVVLVTIKFGIVDDEPLLQLMAELTFWAKIFGKDLYDYASAVADALGLRPGPQ